MKRSKLIIILLSIACNFLFAQNIDGDRVKRNIIALGRKIEQIKILAERYQNDRAIILISKASEEFYSAQNLLEQWASLPRPRSSVKLLAARVHYNLANKFADQAARLILFKPTANLKTELERLIHQAESVAHRGDYNELHYFLNKARAFHSKALTAFSNGQYLRGHEFLKIAIYFAEKTISLAKTSQGDGGRIQKFEQQKNNILVLLNQANNSTKENPVLKELFQNAQSYLKKAIIAFNNGNMKRAYTQLQIAERLVYRIIDLSDNNNTSKKDRLENDYQSLGRYLNSIRNELESSNQKSILLDKADKIYSDAGRNLSAGQYEEASGKLKLSQRMGMRAFKKLSSGSNLDSENLINRINGARHLIELQGERITENSGSSFKSIYDQAVKFFNQSEHAYENQQFPKSSYLLNLTLRLINRNEKLLKNVSIQSISLKELESDLIRIEQIFSRLKENTSLKNKEKVKLTYLTELLLKARNEFEINNLVASREILFIIQQQLSKLRNN